MVTKVTTLISLSLPPSHHIRPTTQRPALCGHLHGDDRGGDLWAAAEQARGVPEGGGALPPSLWHSRGARGWRLHLISWCLKTLLCNQGQKLHLLTRPNALPFLDIALPWDSVQKISHIFIRWGTFYMVCLSFYSHPIVGVKWPNVTARVFGGFTYNNYEPFDTNINVKWDLSNDIP